MKFIKFNGLFNRSLHEWTARQVRNLLGSEAQTIY